MQASNQWSNKKNIEFLPRKWPLKFKVDLKAIWNQNFQISNYTLDKENSCKFNWIKYSEAKVQPCFNISINGGIKPV